jgi:hypothetical protein
LTIFQKLASAAAGALIGLGSLAMLPVAAASENITDVTPADPHGWSVADTRPGGTVSFVLDPAAPRGNGVLELITNNSGAAKAQYLHDANTPLANVTALSYYTKRVSGSPIADPAYQLVTYLTGTSGFTTLVFEPYQNPAMGPISSGWQKWNVYPNGRFWSTRTVPCSNGTITGSPGGPAIYTVAQVNAMCPSAMVIGYGVNIGTNNPGYTVRTDLFDFNGRIYNFEVTENQNNLN